MQFTTSNLNPRSPVHTYAPGHVDTNEKCKKTLIKMMIIAVTILAFSAIATTICYSLPAFAYFSTGLKITQLTYLLKISLAAGMINSGISALSLTVLSGAGLAYLYKNNSFQG